METYIDLAWISLRIDFSGSSKSFFVKNLLLVELAVVELEATAS